jgi:methionyl-tRNA formyltransferase
MKQAATYNKAVVFAYHNVGVRAIKTLLARGMQISLVLTHEDNPNESIWFESVRELCREKDIPCVSPENPNTAQIHEKIAALSPDFIFSFYYRTMLPMSILELACQGAFNLHGSLLPKYRGRVPVNWAVLHGETETGVTLHEMNAKPDAGAIVAQTSVPILPDDTAFDVFGKLTVAAEQTLWNSLPLMMQGRTPRMLNDLSQGSYFGGRKPEDGRISWQESALNIYNLHRAVAPPYPGAFTDINAHRFIIKSARLYNKVLPNLPQGLSVVDNVIYGVAGDGLALEIRELLYQDQLISPAQLLKLISAST